MKPEMPKISKFKVWKWMHHLIFFSFLFLKLAASQSIIKTLPGYFGKLPFKLETGYVSVGEEDDIHLFYYFIESERNPNEDPLVLWLTGGPGCSGLCGLAFEIGPIAFDYSSFNGSLPSFVPRPYSWTKIASVIFIDSPVGTGFSYATKAESYQTSDTLSAKDTDTFMRKWMLNHPMFINNRLYIAGDSYGGKMVPLVTLEISKGNEAGIEPKLSLQGYMVGNPITDANSNANEKIPYSYGMALISQEYYESAKSSCFGEYVNPDPKNAPCLRALQLINECTRNIYVFHILEPVCEFTEQRVGKVFLEDDWFGILNLFKQEERICRDTKDYWVSYVWANDPAVHDALDVRKGKIQEWKKCNNLSSVYDTNVASSFPYHQVLIEEKYPALVYSGDHDFAVPYTATLKWVNNLNLSIDYGWRPWNLNRHVAGYTQGYKKNGFNLTFATIKGAGHTAPEYNPEECFAMVDRWFSYYPL